MNPNSTMPSLSEDEYRTLGGLVFKCTKEELLSCEALIAPITNNTSGGDYRELIRLLAGYNTEQLTVFGVMINPFTRTSQHKSVEREQHDQLPVLPTPRNGDENTESFLGIADPLCNDGCFINGGNHLHLRDGYINNRHHSPNMIPNVGTIQDTTFGYEHISQHMVLCNDNNVVPANVLVDQFSDDSNNSYVDFDPVDPRLSLTSSDHDEDDATFLNGNDNNRHTNGNISPDEGSTTISKLHKKYKHRRPTESVPNRNTFRSSYTFHQLPKYTIFIGDMIKNDPLYCSSASVAYRKIRGSQSYRSPLEIMKYKVLCHFHKDENRSIYGDEIPTHVDQLLFVEFEKDTNLYVPIQNNSKLEKDFKKGKKRAKTREEYVENLYITILLHRTPLSLMTLTSTSQLFATILDLLEREIDKNYLESNIEIKRRMTYIEKTWEFFFCKTSPTSNKRDASDLEDNSDSNSNHVAGKKDAGHHPNFDENNKGFQEDNDGSNNQGGHCNGGAAGFSRTSPNDGQLDSLNELSDTYEEGSDAESTTSTWRIDSSDDDDGDDDDDDNGLRDIKSQSQEPVCDSKLAMIIDYTSQVRSEEAAFTVEKGKIHQSPSLEGRRKRKADGSTHPDNVVSDAKTGRHNKSKDHGDDDDNDTSYHHNDGGGMFKIEPPARSKCIDSPCCVAIRFGAHESLSSASTHGEIEIVQYLRDTCLIEWDTKDKERRAALYFASENGYLKAVQYLVETCHVDAKAKDCDGKTPLHHASENGHLKVVQYFIETCHVDNNAKDNDGKTPLHYASEGGDLEIVQSLMETWHVDATAKDNNGKIALHYASESEDLLSVQYLIEKCHVDKETKDDSGKTALHYASENGDLEIVQYLVETCHVDKEAKNKYGLTALHCASIYRHLKIVQYLIDICRVDKEAKDYSGKTALHFASEGGHLEIVHYLIQTCHVDQTYGDATGSIVSELLEKNGLRSRYGNSPAKSDTTESSLIIDSDDGDNNDGGGMPSIAPEKGAPVTVPTTVEYLNISQVCCPLQKNNVSSVGTSLSGYKHGCHTSTTEKLDTNKFGFSSSASVNMPYDVRSLLPRDGPTMISTKNRNDTYSSIDDEKNDSDNVVGNDAMLHENTNITSNKIAKVRVNQRELPLSSTTQKNQIRHLVQHSYKDLSHEIPPVICENRSDNVAISSSSFAFPIKLHEALSQIQGDKKDHIFGWLPHGRSFKIHCQHDFAAVILPLYFDMTKKSSFLRILNSYGFRRLSDGSYYHERFLRGMKYLCLSIQRQILNGNDLRAAFGNPDEEPNLSDYPTCPPSTSQQDLNHPTIEQRADTESMASMTEHNVCGKGIILIDESGSSRNEDRAARSDSGSNSIISSAECNGRFIELDGSLAPISPSSQSIVVSNQMSVSNSPGQHSFPVNLQRILDELEQDGRTDIISWLPHGRAFKVHDINRFVQEILPSHFYQSKYESFQRQLNVYHITRIVQGPDKGAHYHNRLLRGQPELSKRIRRSTTATPENGNIKK